jgi:hypothetical protein
MTGVTNSVMTSVMTSVGTMDADRDVRAEVPAGPVVELELPSVLESVPYARDLVACRMSGTLRKQVELIVSELVTNAIKHGSGPVGLRVDVYGDHGECVRVAVSDASPVIGEGAGDGYGFHIVRELADATGIDAHDTGKTVWAELRAS